MVSVGAEGKRTLGPLPPGPHGYSREQVAHNQRERLIAAFVELVAAKGYGQVSIAEVIKLARVSRRTFYEHFRTTEDCFLAAFEIVDDHLHDLIREATEPIPDWPHKVSAGIAVVLRFFSSDPDLARLAVVESVTATTVIAARYREAVLGFAVLLEPGRDEREHPEPLPASTEDTVVGSIAADISRQVSAGESDGLGRMLPDLVGFALTPYLEPRIVRKIVRELD